MSFKYTLPTRTKLSENKLKTLLANLRRAIIETPHEGIRGIMANAYQSLFDFATTLALPIFKYDEYRSNDEISLDRYNNTRRMIKDDLGVATTEVGTLILSSNEVFNTTSILATDLETRAGIAASRAQDLSIIEGDPSLDVMVAGDDFSDTQHINYRRSLDSIRTFIDTNQGIVTLARDGSENIITPDADVTVTPLSPNGVTIGPTPENLHRFYEGSFYGLAGEAEPEGGKWHLEEMPDKTTEGSYSYIWVKERGKRTTNAVMEEGNKIAAFEIDEDGDLQNDIIIRDRGATEEEKKAVRKRMLDGNPDTYWRCEYVFRPQDFDPRYSMKDLRADPDATINQFPLPNTNSYWDGLSNSEFNKKFGSALFGKNTQDLLSDSEVPLNIFSAMSEITPETLRANASRYDSYDLEVEIVITLPEPKTINWLNLNPMNFGETSWMKITDIQTTPSRNGEWSKIPGFEENQFANILSEDANAELSQNTQEYVLSASRFQYRGMGVWTFPAREVQKIRFILKQEVPIPNLYQRIHVQMYRTETTEYRHNYNSSNSGSSYSYWDHNREYARVLKLQYLQTLMTFLGNSVTDYAGETEAGVNSASFTANWTGGANFLKGILGIGSGTQRSSSTNRTDIDSGWNVTKYWVETYYDLLSYQLGVRDISAYANQYALKSEFISNEFISPKSLEKVVLKVDHVLPSNTSTDIKYYISVNGGENWLQINPMDTPSRFDETGGVIPRIITFNLPGDAPEEHKYISTDSPVKTIMFKVIMTTEDTNVTPVLKGYRLLMYPLSGLRARDEIV